MKQGGDNPEGRSFVVRGEQRRKTADDCNRETNPSEAAVIYICKLTDGSLQCMTPKGYETTFTKVEGEFESESL
jgi:hypothetical protein